MSTCYVTITCIEYNLYSAQSTAVVIDVVKSLHGCDRELIFNAVSQLRSIHPITSIWKQGPYTLCNGFILLLPYGR